VSVSLTFCLSAQVHCFRRKPRSFVIRQDLDPNTPQVVSSAANETLRRGNCVAIDIAVQYLGDQINGALQQRAP
jgi:hypothetical protein